MVMPTGANAKNAYRDEINFLERKASRIIDWVAKPIIEQIISELLNPTKAKEVYDDLKKTLKEKCIKKGKKPEDFLSLHEKKEGVRIVVKVPAMREVFGKEIDDDTSGGGGRKMKQSPVMTQLMRR